MNAKNCQPNIASGLRTKAEEMALSEGGLRPEVIKVMSTEDVLSMIHDLKVHQIELDIQNEELRRAQAELDVLRARYFDLYDLAPVGYCTISEKGLIVESNLTAATLLGSARGELVNKPLSRFILNEDQDIYYMHRKQLFETDKPQVCVLRMVKKDEKVFWARIEAATATDVEGVSVCRAILSDITESKFQSYEQELSTLLALLINTQDDIHSCMSDIVLILKNWSGCEAIGIRLKSCDDYPYCATSGFSSQFMQKENTLCSYDKNGNVLLDDLGKTTLEGMCGNVICGRFDPSSPFFTTSGSFWTNNATVPIAGSNEVDRQWCTRRRCHDEGYKSLALIPMHADNEMWGLLQFNDSHPNRFSQGLIADMERIANKMAEAFSMRQAKTVLKESEERYSAILAAVDDGLWDWEVESGKAYFSPIYCSILGYDGSEFPSTFDSWLHLVHPEDVDIVKDSLHQSRESGKGFAIDIRMKCKQGKWLWASIRGKTVSTGKVLKMVGTLSDITERKCVEEEKAKLEAKLRQSQKIESIGRLAGGVAHDFNNMLGVILGYVELALDEVSPNQSLYDDLMEIKKAAERSAELARQLLVFARKQPIAPKLLDLNEIVESILKMLRRLIGENIRLLWQPGSHLWLIKVDQTQIDQILTNLCVNSMDAISDTGRIVIETENRTIDEDYCLTHEGITAGDYVRLAVSDNGVGMDKETLSNVFEPFFTTKDVGKGTGLGLATVYGAVKQNNGFINVTSELGQGTMFEIFLPSSKDKTEYVKNSHILKNSLCGEETILLVEDDPAILQIATMILGKQGYTVFAVSNPDDAIRFAKNHKESIHLIIADVIMPTMNGLDLVKVIESFNPNIKHLFMSGYTADVIAHHGVLESGVNFIQKPFSRHGLSAKVKEVLCHKQKLN